MLTCSKEKINIFRIEPDLDNNNKVGNLKSEISLETNFEISNVKFSTDSRYFAIKGKQSNNIFLYDFFYLLKQDKVLYKYILYFKYIKNLFLFRVIIKNQK